VECHEGDPPRLGQTVSVIWESAPWKVDLIRTVDMCESQFSRMSRVKHLSSWAAVVRDQQVEKAVFLSAFIVRKLMDSHRLSAEVEDGEVHVKMFPPGTAERVPDSLNYDRLTDFYDMEKGRRASVPLRQLVNWIIHSYVFVHEVRSDLAGGSLVVGFYFNSDLSRDRQLVRIDWVEYRRVLRDVAKDEVVEIMTLRDGRGREVQLRSAAHLTASQRAAFRRRHQKFIEETMRLP
jgi:hypothetical protein